VKIIAHRGASGYLPEHSLPAKALAYGMGADYLEQDVVASRDGELLVLHDLYLDNVSDVAERFPQRARDDGHFYCIDFDLAEIRSLRFGERIDPATGTLKYPGRFPREAGDFAVHTLSEEIRFIQGLNGATGRSVGIYPEIKKPAWHRKHGIDLSNRILATLEPFGYLKKNSNIYLQCFDSKELKSVDKIVDSAIPLVQLLGEHSYDERDEGLDSNRLNEIAGYAAGIGPSLKLVYSGTDPDGTPKLSNLVGEAHAAGLEVHPYNFRADRLPSNFGDFDELLQLFVVQLEVDGLFTDFPDRVARFLSQHTRLPGI